MKKALLLTVLIGLVGCATAPKRVDFNNEMRYLADYDRVWGAVIAWFAQNNIPIKTLEKESGLVVAESQVFPSQWVDCGKGGAFETRSEPVGTFNVFLRKGDDGRITVQVNSSYHCSRWDDLNNRSMGSMECYSSGIFESKIFDAITQELGKRN